MYEGRTVFDVINDILVGFIKRKDIRNDLR